MRSHLNSRQLQHSKSLYLYRLLRNSIPSWGTYAFLAPVLKAARAAISAVGLHPTHPYDQHVALTRRNFGHLVEMLTQVQDGATESMLIAILRRRGQLLRVGSLTSAQAVG